MLHRFTEGQSLDDWSGNIQRLMEAMRDRKFVQFRRSGTWQPPTNVYETPDSFEICMELAGIGREDVRVECQTPQRLLVSGRRGRPQPHSTAEGCRVHIMEIDEGPFRREFDLPSAIDTQQVEAEYHKGFLWIHLPKTTT